MYDISPGWHTTINPFFYFAPKVLSILALVLFIWLIAIKVFKIKKENYQAPLNIANLVFCILSTILILASLQQFMNPMFASPEEFAFFNRALGPYWFLFLVINLIPLLQTQFFWIKKYRLNINLALFIVFMYNLPLWIEGFLFVGSLFSPG